MRIEKLTVKKDGKTYHGDIAWPDNLGIALQLLGEQEIWEAFKVGYRELAKRRITHTAIRPRRRIARIELSSLDDQTRAVIEEIARLQAAQQLPQQAEQTPPPAPLPIDQTDSGEMPEELPDQFFYNGPELELEPPIGSGALDS